MMRFTSRRATLPLLLGAGALLAACGPANDTRAAVDSTAAGLQAGLPATDTAAGAVAAGTMSNAEILGGIRSANESEIEAGQVASSNATNAQVRQFGERMVTEHRALQQQTAALMDSLSIVAGAQQDSMRQNAQAQLQQLKQLPKGAAFDSTYIASQVMAHRQVLDLLDRSMNATQSQQVQQLIQAARPKIQSHLDEAQRIQGTLSSS